MSRVRFALVAGILLATAVAFAQTRPPAVAPAAPPTPAADYSGMYAVLQEGEFVQVDFGDEGKLEGFISSYGTLESDKGTFLDRFIKSGTWKEKDVTFLTGAVHGIWYEFKGQVVRGEGKTRAAEGYYLLKGTLTEFTTNDVKELCGGRVQCVWTKVESKDKPVYARSRDVSLKSFPQDLEAPKN